MEEIIIEDVECGKSKITKKFDDAGVLIRQDVEIIVDPDKVPGLRGLANLIGGLDGSGLQNN
jgi:hypothetical protein